MKVVTPETMKALEKEAILQGASEADFMEEAGSGVALHIHEFVEKYGLPKRAILLAAKGANSADGYIAALHLLHLEYKVTAFQLVPIEEVVASTQQAIHRFIEEGGDVRLIQSQEELFFPEETLIVDAIFGTGFRGPLEGIFKQACESANNSGRIIISVDIPSGLNGTTGEACEGAITASETSFLSLPKQGLFLRDGPDHAGTLHYVDFGLPQRVIANCPSSYEYLTPDLLMPLLPAIRRSRNKFEAGIVTILAGSPSMQGAALLASMGALRAGAGLVKLFCPHPEIDFGAYPLEIIKEVFDPENPSKFLEWANRSQACLIGPGLGRDPIIKKLLKKVVPKLRIPTVLDADALDFISNEKCKLPQELILTPHLGEMAKLLKEEALHSVSEEMLERVRTFSLKKKAVVALKGWPTFVFAENEKILINSTGDPGLATAGTGDVLSGIITGLLAQKMELKDAASLGVFLHGLAGERASEEKSPYCLIASDLFEYLPDAFHFERG